ncbi:hypothetical protein Poly30_25180 [Planctomycetes bacterium Poly30]|uniref:Uncharacterized protein n=1 Tax=Saltatorellus ferox TaxID=2528018 RepID=A0A518ESC7_9BACT|nr:hypothetical protein Poly30_25180 [Planctomycetes bacterium Poly30]
MITPLRQRHRWLAPGSFAVALLGFAAAIAVRPDPSWMQEGGPETSFEEANLAAEPAGGGRTSIEHSSEHSSGRFSVAVGPVGAGFREVWLLPAEVLDIPDLLVYSSERSSDELTLPIDARLLGPAAQGTPTRFEVPIEAKGLLLFSLGHQTVEAVIALEAP